MHACPLPTHSATQGDWSGKQTHVDRRGGHTHNVHMFVLNGRAHMHWSSMAAAAQTVCASFTVCMSM